MIANQKAVFNPGEELFAWEAYDYHPHERGILWMIMAGIVLFGSSAFFIITEPKMGWITVLCFFIVAMIYFWTHRNGNEIHQVQIFEQGLLIDQRKFLPWERFSGYWFVYDPTVSVINFQYDSKRDQKITLQMGYVEPDKFREIFDQINFPELKDMKKDILELWIRA